MVGWHPIGLENLDILKTDGPTIIDWGGFILVLMEHTVSGYGEKSMVGFGVIKKPGHFYGTMPVATGFTFSFVKNRAPSFLITQPAGIKLIINE